MALSLNQYTTLSVLDQRGGLSNAQLARRSLVSPQSMNEVLLALEQRGSRSSPRPAGAWSDPAGAGDAEGPQGPHGVRGRGRCGRGAHDEGPEPTGAKLVASGTARVRPLARRRPRRPLMPSTRPPAQPSKAPLQSVSIALDVIDTLAEVPELSVSELARRIGVAKSTAHRTCAVLAARGPARSHGGGRIPARPALRGVRAPRHRAQRGPRPWAAAPRRAAEHARRDGADRCARRCRRRVRRARRGSARPSVHHELTALADPPVERGQGARGIQPGHGRRAGEGGPDAEHRLHDRRPEGADRRAEAGAGAGVRAERRRDRARVVVARRPRACRRRRAGHRRDLDGRPHDRVVGEHEARHLAVLQAGAKKLGDAIGKGEYALRRRSR